MQQIMRISMFTVMGVLGLVVGCESTPMPPQGGDPTTAPNAQSSVPPVTRQVIEPVDPTPLVMRPVATLTVWRLVVPAGTISRNEEFWKHVDERAVDLLTYDVLYKNGVRVGRAPLADMEYFTEILGRNPINNDSKAYAAVGAKLIEVAMKQEILAQTIYDFDARNVLTIRSYDISDNLFCIEFQAAPRKTGDLRVSLVPMVRTLRKRLKAIGDFDTVEIDYVSPEKYYNLNLRTDIPLDSFLIVAPSPEASAPMSLGHSFMVHDGGADQSEDVLLLIPQVMRRPDKPATTAPADE